MPSEEEASTAERVRTIVDRDLFLREALARGIVNNRALARWLEAEHGLDANVETVVSALYRYESSKPVDLSAARDVLEGAALQVRERFTALVLRREPVCRNLRALLDAVDLDRRERLRVIQTGSQITVVVEDKNLEAVRDALDHGVIEREVGDLAELEIIAPPEGIDAPGVLELVFAALMVRGIPVRFAMSGYPEQLVFVDSGHAPATYDAVSELVRPRALRG